MKRRCSNTGFIVLHGEVLSIQIPADVRSPAVQRCHDFIFFHAQIRKAFSLCSTGKIRLFGLNQPCCIAFGCTHLFCKAIDCLLGVLPGQDVPGKFTMKFRNQLVLVVPDTFWKVEPISRPRFHQHLIKLFLVNTRHVETNIEPLLKFVCGAVVSPCIGSSHRTINHVSLISKQLFKALLGLDLQGFQLADMEFCRSVFQFLHPLTIQGIFTTIINVLLNCPLKFLQVFSLHPLAGFSHRDSVVISKTLIPCGNLPFNLLLGLLVLGFQLQDGW